MSWSRSAGAGANRVLRGAETELLERANITTPLTELVHPTPSDVHVVTDQVEDPLAAAYAAGVLEGHARARAEIETEANERHEQQLSKLAASLTSAAEALVANRQALIDELFEDIGNVVFELVRELVGVELSIAEEPARDAVTRALREAPANTDLVVRLHPRAAIAAWELESLAPGRRLRVIEDQSVEITGCVLEVGSTTIDAQIGPALARLHETLMRISARARVEEDL